MLKYFLENTPEMMRKQAIAQSLREQNGNPPPFMSPVKAWASRMETPSSLYTTPASQTDRQPSLMYSPCREKQLWSFSAHLSNRNSWNGHSDRLNLQQLLGLCAQRTQCLTV